MNIVISIRDGVVDAISTDKQDTEIYILDYDVLEETGITDDNGNNASLFHFTAKFDPDEVKNITDKCKEENVSA